MQQQSPEAHERRLWKEYKRFKRKDSPKAQAARNRLVEHYMPLVRLLAAYVHRKMASNAVVNRDDLVSYGSLGLMRAVERFEPARGLKFITFASPRVRGAMLDGLRATDFVPRSAREAFKRDGVVPVEMMPCGDVNPDVNPGGILPPDEAMIQKETRRELLLEIAKHLPGTISPYIIKRHFLDGADFKTIAKELPGCFSAEDVEQRCSEAVASLKDSRLKEILLD